METPGPFSCGGRDVARRPLPIPGRSRYGAVVSARSPEHWSLFRSLAFLAATFAIMLGALLPTAVAASAASGSPIMLCSGEQIFVDGDGRKAGHDQPTPMDTLTCASCVLTALTALPPPPPVHPAAPPRILVVQPAAVTTSLPACGPRQGPRPPSTAPPVA